MLPLIVTISLILFDSVKCGSSVVDCGVDNQGAVIKFSKLMVPEPLYFERNNTLDLAFTVIEDTKPSDKVRMKLSKRVGPFWVTAPCIAGIGSCTSPFSEWFSDPSSVLCTILKGFGKNCGPVISKGVYANSVPVEISAEAFPSIFQSLLSGDYYVLIELIDESEKVVKGCVEANVDLEFPDEA